MRSWISPKSLNIIDTPVKRYSSGMYLRLAFAVAAHLEPEILVVDEVLAVGDAEFQTQMSRQDERCGPAGTHGSVRQPQHVCDFASDPGSHCFEQGSNDHARTHAGSCGFLSCHRDRRRQASGFGMRRMSQPSSAPFTPISLTAQGSKRQGCGYCPLHRTSHRRIGISTRCACHRSARGHVSQHHAR